MSYYYYLFYKEDINELMKKLNLRTIRFGISENINSKNDIIMVHIIYNLIKTKKITSKNKIRNYIYDRVKYLFEKSCEDIEKIDFKQFDESFNELFNYCWVSEFSVLEKGKRKHLCDIAYGEKSIFEKIFNNNIFIVLFASFFFWLQMAINNSFFVLELNKIYSFWDIFCLTLIISGLGFSIASVVNNKLRIYPIYSLVLMILLCIFTI